MKISRFFALILLILIGFSFIFLKWDINKDKKPAADNLYFVKRVIDGDTILLSNGKRVRYIGINTPESVAPNRPVECFGKEASGFNKKLVEHKYVRLERDISDVDKYGRWLRYVYIDGTFVNLKLVEEGYAYAYTVPPDVKYADLFLKAQREAKEKGKGLWGKCQKKR